MPYRKELFQPNCFYHVYNRGILKRQIFFVDRDYEMFLSYLGRSLEKIQGAFLLHAYCLMPNHFHLIIEQRKESSLSGLIGGCVGVYVKYFNQCYKRKGGLFEGRFKAKLIQTDEYLLYVSKYIHRNPINAGLVRKGVDYKWSSYVSYLSELKQPFVETETILSCFKSYVGGGSYGDFVEEKPIPEIVSLKIGKELFDVGE